MWHFGTWFSKHGGGGLMIGLDDLRGLFQPMILWFLWGKAERFGAVQPGEEKALVRPYCGLPVPEGACRKAGEGLFTRACSDRTRGNGFKLNQIDLDWI